MKYINVGNENFEFSFDFSKGIHLVEIMNKNTGDNYLKDNGYWYHGNPFLIRSFTIEKPYHIHHKDYFKIYSAPRDFSVQQVKVSEGENGRRLLFVKGKSESLASQMRIEVLGEGEVSYWSLSLKNVSDKPLFLKTSFPFFNGLRLGEEAEDDIACIPIQTGAVNRVNVLQRWLKDVDVPLDFRDEKPNNIHIGPLAMQFISEYDKKLDEGLFLAVLDKEYTYKTISIEHNDDRSSVFMRAGFQITLQPKQTFSLPKTAVGIHKGDWQAAASFYSQWASGWKKFPNVPKWFKEAGGIYGAGVGGGGGAFLFFTKEKLRPFTELPRMMEEAEQIGTKVLYLWDYWEGEKRPGWEERAKRHGGYPYFNKGDYRIRKDLGGEAGLREGVKRVHERGGRVILYVEGFIISKYSEVGMRHGQDWALMREGGKYYEDYENYWSMCPACEGWQNYLADTSKRLVNTLDIDGIFLDSTGAQWNHMCYNPKHKHFPNPYIWNHGQAEMTTKVREAVKNVKEDAIVMTESTDEVLISHVDGSCDGIFVWHNMLIQNRLNGSPLKYVFPMVNVFTNGPPRSGPWFAMNLNEPISLAGLNQVFAFGYGLALGPGWLPKKDYIKRLLEIRRNLKDSLIYGRIKYLPKSTSQHVTSCMFEGKEKLVITAINASKTDEQLKLQLSPSERDIVWVDEITGEVIPSVSQRGEISIPMKIKGGGLRVLSGSIVKT